MKILQKLCLLSALFFCLNVGAQQIKFYKPKHKFGFVKQGALVKMKFKFKNIGTEDLILTDFIAECSCTTVILPSKPIKPNEDAEVIIEFNTKDAYDRQDRIVEIISNATNGNQKLHFKGIVLRQKK